MHRSGSSAITRCMNLLGFDIPNTLIKNNKSNLRGHWESQPLARLNDKYLSQAGLSWSDWRLGGLDRTPTEFRNNFLADLKALLTSEFTGFRAPVIKEPRICRLLPVYNELFAASGGVPHYLIIFRNPLEVIASLIKRNDLSKVDAALLWLRYTTDILRGSAGHKRAFVAYDHLLDRPIDTLKRACEQLDLATPNRIEDGAEDIQSFLSSDLQKHHLRSEDVIHDDITRGWISELYDALRLLMANPSAQAALDTSRRVIAEFNAATPYLDTAFSHASHQIKEANEKARKASACAELRAEQIRLLKEENILAARMGIEALEETENTTYADYNNSNAYNAIISKTDQTQTLLDRLRKTEKAHRALQRQNLRLQDEIAYRKDIIAAIQNSPFWRISAPLRKVVTAARQTRHALSRRQGAPDQDGSNKRKQKRPRDDGDRLSLSLVNNINLVKESPMFDQAWYLSRYPDAQLHATGAAAHYVTQGWRKGYDPSASFKTDAYIASHEDILAPDECPLAHYLKNTSPQNSAYATASHNCKIAIFTAVAGGYDTIAEPIKGGDDADFYVFTDGEIDETSVWKRCEFEYVSSDPTRTARFVKTHPHLYFKDYDWAIWIDANLTLNSKPEAFLPNNVNRAEAFTWRHPLRNCVYQEGKECVRRYKDHPKTIDRYLARLKAHKFPAKSGLFETSVFVSKMNAPKLEAFYSTWWAEIDKGTKRDQISLPYAVEKSGISIDFLGRERMCMRTDPRVIYHRHAAF